MRAARLWRACLPFVTCAGLAACFGTGCGPADKPQADKGLLFDGKSLRGWKVLREGFFDAPGKVYARDGQLVLEAGQALTGVTCTGELPDMGYEVSLEAMRVQGEDFFLGMTFPIGKEFATLILGGWGGQVVGISNVNNLHAGENETTQIVEFKSGQWYRVRLSVTGDLIQVWLDDKETISLATKDKRFSVWPQQEPVRPFGLASYYTKAAYRNVRVRRLDE